MPIPLWMVADLIAIAAISLWEPLGRLDDERFSSDPAYCLFLLILTYAIRLFAMAGVVLITATLYLTSLFS